MVMEAGAVSTAPEAGEVSDTLGGWLAAVDDDTVTVRVADERPAGFFATDYATVRLQVRSGSRWRSIPHTKEMTDDGRYVYRIERIGKTVKVRAITAGSDNYTGSESRPVTLR